MAVSTGLPSSVAPASLQAPRRPQWSKLVTLILLLVVAFGVLVVTSRSPTLAKLSNYVLSPPAVAPDFAVEETASDYLGPHNDDDDAAAGATAGESAPIPSKLYPPPTSPLPWEKASISVVGGPAGICSPPPGTPSRCCFGGTSAGGDVHWSPRICSDLQFARLRDDMKGAVGEEGSRSSYGARDLINALHVQKRRLAVIGDSVMYQNVVGLECGWLREGCRNAKSVNNKNKVPPYEKRVFEGAFPGPAWKYGIGGIEQWTVACPPIDAATDKNELNVDVDFYLQYRPFPDFKDIQDILSNPAVDTLLLNSGLHYLNSDDDLRSFELETKGVMEVVKRWVDESGGRNLVLWRETTQQHRDSIGGEWNYKGRSENCAAVVFGGDPAPSRAKVVDFQWRDKLVRKFLDDVGFEVVSAVGGPQREERDEEITPVHWISFTNFTLDKEYFHPINGEGQCEPTHFCQTPDFWALVWSSVTNVLVNRS